MYEYYDVLILDDLLYIMFWLVNLKILVEVLFV